MPWIIAAVVILLLMARTAKATISPNGGQSFRLQQLAGAISGIEGGTAANPGNIRTGNEPGAGIAESADLTNLLNRAFVSQNSRYYNAGMTFQEFAWMYVAGTAPGNWEKVAKGDNPDNWAAYVAGHLGVSTDSLVVDFLNS